MASPASSTSPQTSPAAAGENAGTPVAGAARAFGRQLEPCQDRAALPAPLVRRIIGYLPLTMHGQCALVCRSWHANVPDTRKTLAHWRQGLSLLQWHSCRQMASGYSSRLRPFLQASRDAFVPVLDCQHQEWRRLEALAGVQATELVHKQRQKAFTGLCALIGWRLHQRLQEPDPLALPEVPLADNTGQVCALGFSACSRWMAVASRPDEAQDTGVLHLYGWSQAGWQAQRLQRLAQPGLVQDRPVEHVLFSVSEPDRLCTSHSGGGVISWSRQPDTGLWQAVSLLPATGRYRVTQLVTYEYDQLFLVYEQPGTSGQGVLLLHDRDDSHGWRRAPAAWYQRLTCVALAPGGGQVAMAVAASGADTDLMALHIWQWQAGMAGRWHCTPTGLETGQQLLHLHYSPTGGALLGLMAGSRVCLWQLDSECRAGLRLDVACSFSAACRDLAAQRLFDHDGRQLALALSASVVQLYANDGSDSWQPGERLLSPFQADDRQDLTRYILLSGDGRMLLQVNYCRIRLWQRNGVGLFWHKLDMDSRQHSCVLPQAVLLSPFYMFCATTVLWQAGKLWIHGTDDRGRIAKKTGTPPHPVPLSGLVSSPDGLSLVVMGGRPCRLRVRQLTTLEQACRAQCLQEAVPDQDLALEAVRQLPGDEARAMPVGAGDPGPAQTLPAELLELIFHLVPLVDHSGCAQVCRHWYRSLPATRLQLAWWLQQRAPRPRPDLYQLADSYSALVRLRLQAGSCRLLPALDALHQRLQGLDARAQPVGWHRARRLLSGLIHYSLHLQQIRADRLEMAFPVIEGGIETSIRSRISYCGRWLATALPADPQARPVFLHLHGWTAGGWQPERLDGTAGLPVAGFVFCRRRTDTLISIHAGMRLFSWTRDPVSGVWRSVFMVCISLVSRVRELLSLAGGDFVSLHRGNEGWEQLVLTPWRQEQAGWGQAVSLSSAAAFGPLAAAPGGSQLICTMPPTTAEEDYVLDLWSRDPIVPGEWIRREAAGRCHQRVERLVYSPDGTHLLGLLAGDRARLWQVEGRLRLRQRLDLARSPCLEHDLRVWQPFREDGRQLVIAASTAQMQLWDRQAEGDWTAGDVIATSTAPSSRYAQRIRYMVLSADGRTLIRSTPWELGVWRRADAGSWQQVISRCTQPGDDAYPNGWLVPGGGPLCVTAAGNEGQLWVHGPDSQGQWVKKAAFCVGQGIRWLHSSPDGQTLRFLLGDATPVLVQLGT